uniref:Uncharacterized protein n=1 Tax=Arundo donax TaxID=35708 RepID=A0A0A9CKH6_ARUDO
MRMKFGRENLGNIRNQESMSYLSLKCHSSQPVINGQSTSETAKKVKALSVGFIVTDLSNCNLFSAVCLGFLPSTTTTTTTTTTKKPLVPSKLG